MLHLCFPDHFGALTLLQIFCKIQEFFSAVPNCEDIRFINDDLIGFFNSVPQDRILECVCVLLQRYRQLSADEFITVCVARGPREIKSVAGRARGAGDPKYWKHIQLSDLSQIAQPTFLWYFHSLQFSMEAARRYIHRKSDITYFQCTSCRSY